MWLKKAASEDHIKDLERYMEDIQRGIEDINDTREGGYLLRELAEAKDESITCKEDHMGGGFSSDLSLQTKTNYIES